MTPAVSKRRQFVQVTLKQRRSRLNNSSCNIQGSTQGVGVRYFTLPWRPLNTTRTKRRAHSCWWSTTTVTTLTENRRTTQKSYNTLESTLKTQNIIEYTICLHLQRPQPHSGRPIRAHDVTWPWRLLTAASDTRAFTLHCRGHLLPLENPSILRLQWACTRTCGFVEWVLRCVFLEDRGLWLKLI